MFYLNKIEDILKAAIQDAGLDANMQMHNTGCSNLHENEANLFTSSSNSNYNYVNNEINNNTELLLGDFDFNLLGTDSTTSYSTSNHVNQSSTNSILTDDNDPFLVALNQLDEHNSKANSHLDKGEDEIPRLKTDYDTNNNNASYTNSYKSSSDNTNNFSYMPSNTSSESNIQPRKIIKLNLTNHSTTSTNMNNQTNGGLMSQTLTCIKTQPIVRLISSNSQQNTSSGNSNSNKSNSNDLIR
jgi:hypothetical protein